MEEALEDLTVQSIQAQFQQTGCLHEARLQAHLQHLSAMQKFSKEGIQKSNFSRKLPIVKQANTNQHV